MTGEDERLDGRDEHVSRIFVYRVIKWDSLVQGSAGSNGVVDGVVDSLFAWNCSWAAYDSLVYQTANVTV